jgi:hypothetical protein
MREPSDRTLAALQNQYRQFAKAANLPEPLVESVLETQKASFDAIARHARANQQNVEQIRQREQKRLQEARDNADAVATKASNPKSRQATLQYMRRLREALDAAVATTLEMSQEINAINPEVWARLQWQLRDHLIALNEVAKTRTAP